MVRKRLSDMMREEAQKPIESESDPASSDLGADPASTAQSKPAAKSRSAATGSRAAATSQPSTAIASKEKAAAIAPEVTRLKAEMETATKQVTDLNQQVTALKAELEDQITASKKLQPTLEKTEKRNRQLEIELSEAKQTILQLVEVNSQLKQDLAVKQQTVAIPEAIPRGIAPSSKSSLPASPIVPAEPKKSTLASATSTHQEFLQRQQKSLAHPVFPAGNSPGHLSDQDLGWVD